MFSRLKNPKPDLSEKADTAQEWLPLRDITNNVLIRRDGYLVAVLRVEPLNLTLKSESEKKRIIGSFHEAINGLKDRLLIFCLGRPVDLDAYIQSLEDKYRYAPDTQRKTLIREYLRYVGGIASSGEALEHRFYILLSQAPEKHAYDELMKRSYELAGNVARAGLTVKVCDDREIIDLQFNFTHPVQSAYERAPEFSLPTIPPQYREVVK